MRLMISATWELLWKAYYIINVQMLTQCLMHRNNKQTMIISWILNSYLNVCFPLFHFAEVSAVFEAGTSVTYMFQEPYPVTKNLSQSSSAIYAELAPSKENIALSFVTAQAPSLLLYINSSSHDFLAVLLCKNGEYSWQEAWWSVILGERASTSICPPELCKIST